MYQPEHSNPQMWEGSWRRTMGPRVPIRGKVKGKGHKGMELKQEIEGAPSDEEDCGPPALITAEGKSNNETCGRMH